MRNRCPWSLLSELKGEIKLFSRFFSVLLIAVGLVGAERSLNGQDKPSISGDLEGLAALHREFDQHSVRRSQLLEEQKRIQSVLDSTRKNLETIRNEGMQKQLALLQLSWEQNSYLETLQNLADSPPRRTKEIANPTLPITMNRSNLLLSSMDSALNVAELQQLDSAARITVERRIKSFQEGAKLQQDCSKWIEERPAFFNRYWRFTDPIRIRSRTENEAILGVLRNRASDNYPAMIAQCLLEERLGKSDAALVSIELVIKGKTPLHNIALMARSMVYVGMEEPKKAKADLLESLKLDRTNPYFRWMRAVVSANSSEWKTAESEATALLKSKEHELAARRLLSAIYCMQAQKIPRLATKALEQATVVRGFCQETEWSSSLLMAMALSVSNKAEEALVLADSAAKNATDENQVLCNDVSTSIQAKRTIEWNFLRH